MTDNIIDPNKIKFLLFWSTMSCRIVFHLLQQCAKISVIRKPKLFLEDVVTLYGGCPVWHLLQQPAKEDGLLAQQEDDGQAGGGGGGHAGDPLDGGAVTVVQDNLVENRLLKRVKICIFY